MTDIQNAQDTQESSAQENDYLQIDNPVLGIKQTLVGGSFFHAPIGLSDIVVTVNLMEEKPELTCDIYIPVRDFSAPRSNFMFERVFEDLLSDGRVVYAGCWGGIGRTGLFLACFLKYMGHPDPLSEVREKHHPHAVETDSQKEFLDNFPVRQAPSLNKSPSP